MQVHPGACQERISGGERVEDRRVRAPQKLLLGPDRVRRGGGSVGVDDAPARKAAEDWLGSRRHATPDHETSLHGADKATPSARRWDDVGTAQGKSFDPFIKLQPLPI